MIILQWEAVLRTCGRAHSGVEKRGTVDSFVNPVLPQHLLQFLIPRAEHSGNFLWTAQCRMITTIYNNCCQVPQITCTADSANMTVCEEVFNATLTINLADVIANVPNRALELTDLTQ